MIAAEASEKQYCILLVDDEENILRSLKRELMDVPYSLLTASSSSEAIELLKSNIVSVVITDQRMPGGNGTELLSIVREKYPDTVRILLTAFTDMQDIIEAINESGIYKYIQKPWKSDDLKNIIGEATNQYCMNMDKKNKPEILHGPAVQSVVSLISNSEMDYSAVRAPLARLACEGHEHEHILKGDSHAEKENSYR
jgi:response regulator RpfG family c-di-GMP phosphodiesterase